MGLNEVYTTVRGSILMMNPLPSTAQAFSLLIQEERQREVKPHNQLFTDSTSFHVNTGGSRSTNFKANYSPNNYHVDRDRSKLFCDYCKRAGRVMAKCHKLHGYPHNGITVKFSPNVAQNPRPNLNTEGLRITLISNTIILDLIANTIGSIGAKEQWLMCMVLLLMKSLLEAKYYHRKSSKLVMK
ncbi:hypothetical protein P3S67_006235 [Capsicum chacoense]